MAAALANLPADTAVLDAELIHVSAGGLAEFFALLRQIRMSKPDQSPMAIMAFDVLFQEAVDLRGLPAFNAKPIAIEQHGAVGKDASNVTHPRAIRPRAASPQIARALETCPCSCCLVKARARPAEPPH
jgi:hypothetical protein